MGKIGKDNEEAKNGLTYEGAAWTEAHEKAELHIRQLMTEAQDVARQFKLQMHGAWEVKGGMYESVAHGKPEFGLHLMDDIEKKLPTPLKHEALMNKLRGHV